MLTCTIGPRTSGPAPNPRFRRDPSGTASANPDELDADVRATTPADQELNDVLAGLPALVETWNGSPSDFGGGVDGAKLAAIDTAVDELSYLDLWVGEVAAAFRAVDRFCPLTGCGPIARPELRTYLDAHRPSRRGGWRPTFVR